MQSTANKDKSNRTSELLTIPRENFDRLLEHCKQHPYRNADLPSSRAAPEQDERE